MSSTHLQPPPPATQSRRRRRRWLIVGTLAVPVLGAGVVGLFFFFHDTDLHDAIAEADRLDPGWRFEEMEAARAVVPDADNGALVVLAAHRLIPPKWLPGPGEGGAGLGGGLPPPGGG